MFLGISLKWLTVSSSPLALSIPDNTSEDPSQPRAPLSSSTNASDHLPDLTIQEAHAPRDLSSLLDPQNYFEIPQDDIPDAFRVSPPGVPPDEPLPVSLERLDSFLQSGNYLCAAILAGLILWSGQVSPTDHHLIFSLLSTRFACLSLFQSLRHIAAQEARILFGDVNNDYWCSQPFNAALGDATSHLEHPHWSIHIIPFEFRLQIITLQTLTFAEGGRPDGRRGIPALYELALECRERASSPSATQEEHIAWQGRLWDLSMLVVNALIEMDELETAGRHLQNTLGQLDSSLSHETSVRMVLLLLRIGDVASAQRLLESSLPESSLASMLHPLISVVNGDYSSAVSEFQDLLSKDPENNISSIVKQNLAVCLLYSGYANNARSTLQSLVDDGYDFRSLTFNLATLYELSSDKSLGLKLGLVEKVKGLGLDQQRSVKESADFKL